MTNKHGILTKKVLLLVEYIRRATTLLTNCSDRHGKLGRVMDKKDAISHLH
jgi:hypothetical protein